MGGILTRIRNVFGGSNNGARTKSQDGASGEKGAVRDDLHPLSVGDLEDAGEEFRRVLEDDPANTEALYRLGEIAHLGGDIAGAIDLFERGIEAEPGSARFHYALGCMWQSAGQPVRAMASFRGALARDPGHAAAHNNVGHLLHHLGEIALHGNADAASLMSGGGDSGDARVPLSDADARQAGRAAIEEAIGHFRAAIRIAPRYAVAHLNLGFAMMRKMRLEEAIAHYEQALAIDPDLVDAHFNKALVLLAQARFDEGWAEYEWRWRKPDSEQKPEFGVPECTGSELEGRTVLLHAEQGFGDSIQFIRYARKLSSQGARVLVRCQAELKELFASAPGVSCVLTQGDALPAFDEHLALLSTARVLGTGLDDMSSTVPYLHADPLLVERWRAEIASMAGSGGAMLKVGLVWASEPRNAIAPLKSVRLGDFRPLLGQANTIFFSLQKGGVAHQLTEFPAGKSIIDLAEHIGNFSDTAAIIANLDLVITVDTAVAHLTGAMGMPVWTLLQYAPDWRWFPLAAESVVSSSCWYPGMRLYRQPIPGDWASVLRQVSKDLREIAMGEKWAE